MKVGDNAIHPTTGQKVEIVSIFGKLAFVRDHAEDVPHSIALDKLRPVNA